VIEPKRSTASRPASAGQRPEWWREGVVYQVYPRSFADSDGNGVGDLQGIVDRLDYLGSDGLGIDAIWLSPIYPSPGLDVGYDVSDHERVDPLLGTEADFDRLVDEAHRRGIRIVLDLVMNHTSDQHRWFEASREARVGPYADWYLWRDPAGIDELGNRIPPNNWVSFFGGSAWEWEPRREQFYLHTFLPQQPDLNWRNPEVEAAQYRMVRRWLERGVDGFRLDVFNVFLKHPELLANPVVEGATAWARQVHLNDRDQPDFAALLERFRAVVDEYPDRFTVGELFDAGPDRAAMLTTDRHLVFDWEMVIAPWSASAFAAFLDRREAAFGDERWPTLVLSNHDQPRHASRLARSAGTDDVDAVAKAAAVLLLALRGTTFLYYGEEIGMVDVPIPPDEIVDPPARLANPDFPWWNRDQCRTPMQWSPAPGAGFTSGRPWIRIADDTARRNVEVERRDPASVFATYQRLLRARRAHPALHRGTFARIALDSEEVLAWTRSADDELLLVLLNFGTDERPVTIPGDLAGGDIAWRPIAGTHLDPRVPDAEGAILLRGFEGVILYRG
jgi:alpha-glucosidase